MQSLRTEIGAEIRAANGELVRRIPFRECHSLLKGFIQMLTVQMAEVHQFIRDYTGTVKDVRAASDSLGVNATTQTDQGIVIGSGDTVVTMEDYKLETQITTNISHLTVSFAVENPDSDTWRLAVSRGFTNNTGADVDVNEVALYGAMYPYAYICMDRTLYAVTFSAGETLTMTYRISVSL